jgi:hypothetical protein
MDLLHTTCMKTTSCHVVEVFYSIDEDHSLLGYAAVKIGHLFLTL